ncbi:MAG: hypothetical protein LBS82_01470 [Spirochaetaceae bacterium]|jgi:hypothetical protein|nr:hypothetical protein [Spirochaetaceae bacterium]
MSGKSWLPGKREDQLSMAKVWFTVLAETNPAPGGGDQTNAFAWGVPETLVMELNTQISACAELLAKLADPETSTKVSRSKCKTAFTQLKKKMRALRKYFYLDAFPEAELVRLGQLPYNTSGGASIADPTDHVEFEFIIDPIGRKIIVRFRILGSKRWGKGRYHSVEIRYWILPLDESAPVDADAPGWQSDTDTASPWETTCKGEDAGKRIWVAMRWKNASTGESNQQGGRGPWSEIKGVVIP